MYADNRADVVDLLLFMWEGSTLYTRKCNFYSHLLTSRLPRQSIAILLVIISDCESSAAGDQFMRDKTSHLIFIIRECQIQVCDVSLIMLTIKSKHENRYSKQLGSKWLRNISSSLEYGNLIWAVGVDKISDPSKHNLRKGPGGWAARPKSNL